MPMNTAQTHTASMPRQQRGLTLIEMMTALIIGSVLLAGLTQVFVASRQGYKLSESLGYLQESGRLALYTITDDLRRAGYWGGNADVTSFAGSSVALIEPVAANFNTCPTSDTTWARLLQQRAFGLDESAGTYACVPNSGAGKYARGDVVVARFADASQLDPVANPLNANSLYIRTSLFEGRLFAGSDQANPLNAISLTNGPVGVHALTAHGYYVADSGATCDGTSVPSLYRITLGDTGSPEVQDIIAGVEDLQVQWGVDSDGDGVPNQYLDADNITATWWNWPGFPSANTVISARVYVLTRAECPDPTYTNDQSYTLGTKVVSGGNDHYRRQVYSATVALRN
jgi:type IV pilus assembly protein PilW